MKVSTIRRVWMLAVALLILSGSLCFAEGAQERVVLRVASPFKAGHILVDAAEKFKSMIEEETDGRISVLLIAGAASEEDVNIQCSQGVVDIQLTGGRPLEVFSPQYFFFNAPYVIKDYEHFVRVWKGPSGQESEVTSCWPTETWSTWAPCIAGFGRRRPTSRSGVPRISWA